MERDLGRLAPAEASDESGIPADLKHDLVQACPGVRGPARLLCRRQRFPEGAFLDGINRHEAFERAQIEDHLRKDENERGSGSSPGASADPYKVGKGENKLIIINIFHILVRVRPHTYTAYLLPLDPLRDNKQ